MSLRLLIAEDDAPSLELMSEVFTSLKAEVLPVGDAHEAAALVNKEKFDGVFLDLEMPKMHGFDLARRVRESSWNKSTPIVIVTGRDDRTTMQQAFAAGATFFLQKPVDRQRLSTLFRAVRGSLLENRRRNARVPLHTEVVCELDSRVLQGTSWNLSQGGMQIETAGLKSKDNVRVLFRLPTSGERIDALAVVMWQTERRQGLQFAKMNPQSAEAIRAFIAEVEKPD
ncbi:MAG TPA: response regulator [Terriglobales bacterium]|jgi:CheY-like chemotaxis protein|nr:response regulator [Terriglobales bacterium]